MQALKAFFFFELFCTSSSKNPRAAQIAEEYFKHYFRQINQCCWFTLQVFLLAVGSGTQLKHENICLEGCFVWSLRGVGCMWSLNSSQAFLVGLRFGAVQLIWVGLFSMLPEMENKEAFDETFVSFLIKQVSRGVFLARSTALGLVEA